MKGYDAATYGDLMAGVYDEWFGVPQGTNDTVEFLEGLAGSGPVLELDVGTGRVALPLAERGTPSPPSPFALGSIRPIRAC